jgi:hypothetical protein
MPLIFRLVKGAPVTWEEGDDNLRYLEGLAISSSINFNNWTGSALSQFAGTASLALTASYALNAGTTIDTGSLVTTSSFNSFTSSYNTGSFSGSFTGSLYGTASWAENYNETDPIFTAKSSSLATTGSNTFIGNQTITGSLTITNNLNVLGSASITYISESTLNIGTNLITVNTLNPYVRFGGLAVIDSGSSPQVSGSILFDSQKDQFIFTHQSSPLTSSVFLLGPETYNNLGNEIYLTQNRIPKGTGIEHLNDSNISDDGSIVSINSNTQVTGSLTVTNGMTGSLFGTASWANNAISSSFATTASFAVSASWAPSSILSTSFISTGSVSASVSVNTSSLFEVVSGSTLYFRALNNSSGFPEWQANSSLVIRSNSGIIRLATGGNNTLSFNTNGLDRWFINGSGNLLAIDNTHDIGLSGSNRPRNIYTSGTGSVFAALDITFGSTNALKTFPSTGNTFLGSTPVDGGFRLDVNGTTRMNGNTTVQGRLTVIANDYDGLRLSRNTPNSLDWFRIHANNDFNPILFTVDTTSFLSYNRDSSRRYIFLNNGTLSTLEDSGNLPASGSTFINNPVVYNGTSTPYMDFWSPSNGGPASFLGRIQAFEGTTTRKGGIDFFSSDTPTGQGGFTGLTHSFRIHQNGGVSFGTTTDSGFRLDVSGSGASGSVRFQNGLTITGSATITNVLTLPYQDPLPSSPATGSIALSGSGATFVGMFVWTGVWTQI